MMFNGTREAFMYLINQRGVYKELGVAKVTVVTWRRAMRGKGREPTLNKMEELLLKAGYVVKKEKVWEAG